MIIGNAISPFKLSSAAPFWDADALTFISDISLTRDEDKLAVNHYFKQFKLYGIFNKIIAFYPLVGATAGKHGFNLKNKNTFYITWTNSPQHNLMGVRFNGTSNYGRSGIIPSTHITIHDFAGGIYSKTNFNNNGYAFAAVSSASSQVALQLRNAGALRAPIHSATNFLSETVSDSTEFSLVSKTAINSLKAFKRGAQIGATQTGCVGTLPTVQIYLGAGNSAGVPANYAAIVAGCYFFSTGLTDAEATIVDTIIEAGQTILGRGVGQGYNITYEGDSFMSANGDLVARMETYLSWGSFVYTSKNLSVTGCAIGYPLGSNNYMLYSTRYNAVTANYHSGFGKNILLCHEGVNELNFQLTLGGLSASDAATAAYDNCVAYYGALVGQASNGYKCILNTTTPRSDVGAHANYETARQNAADKYDPATFNGKLRNDFTVATAYTRVFTSNLAKWAGCVLVDMGDDPNFGQAGQSTDTAWYDADGIHPKNSTMTQALINNYYSRAFLVISQGVV